MLSVRQAVLFALKGIIIILRSLDRLYIYLNLRGRVLVTNFDSSVHSQRYY